MTDTAPRIIAAVVCDFERTAIGTRSRLGIALPHQGRDHLFHQPDLSISRGLERAQVPRLDPEARHLGERLGDGQRGAVVVIAARAGGHQLELLKLRERRLVQVGGLQQLFAREPDVARVFAERLGPGQALGGDECARNPRTSSRLLSGLETAVDRLKVVFDDAQRQIVIALGGEHVTQPLNVGVGELAIAGRRALWLDQPFSFKEADLRDRDVGKVGPQLG